MKKLLSVLAIFCLIFEAAHSVPHEEDIYGPYKPPTPEQECQYKHREFGDPCIKDFPKLQPPAVLPRLAAQWTYSELQNALSGNYSTKPPFHGQFLRIRNINPLNGLDSSGVFQFESVSLKTDRDSSKDEVTMVLREVGGENKIAIIMTYPQHFRTDLLLKNREFMITKATNVCYILNKQQPVCPEEGYWPEDKVIYFGSGESFPK